MSQNVHSCLAATACKVVPCLVLGGEVVVYKLINKLATCNDSGCDRMPCCLLPVQPVTTCTIDLWINCLIKQSICSNRQLQLCVTVTVSVQLPASDRSRSDQPDPLCTADAPHSQAGQSQPQTPQTEEEKQALYLKQRAQVCCASCVQLHSCASTGIQA